MSATDTFLNRNRAFAATRFDRSLRMRPSLHAVVIGCVDPRADPAFVLGADQGEALVLRNVGGRVTPGLIAELLTLREVARAAGADLGPGWEIVVMQHTQCGITLIQDRTELLGPYFQAAPADLPGLSVGDPRAAVARDVAALRAEPGLAGVTVSGLVYDVATGLADAVTGAG